jgi:hypothetical protein
MDRLHTSRIPASEGGLRVPRRVPSLASALAGVMMLGGASPLCGQTSRTPPPVDPPTADLSATGQEETDTNRRGQPPADDPMRGAPLDAPPGLGPAGQPTSGWTLQARFQESWDTNPTFRALGIGTEPGGAFSEDARALLGFSHQRVRAGFSIWGEGGAQRYREPDDDGLSYGGGLWAFYRPASRVTVSVTEILAYRYSRGLPALADAGLLLPLGRQAANTTAGSVAVRVAERTTLTTDVRYDKVVFDTPGLVDGAQLVGSAQLVQRTGTSGEKSASYQYRRSFWPGRTANTHSLLGGWRRDVNPWLNIGLAAGVGTLQGQDAIGENALGVVPIGEARLLVNLRRTALGLRYSRAVDAAYGLGRDRVGDVFSADLTRTAGRQVALGAAAVWTRSRDPLDASFRYDTQRYGGDVRWTVGRGVILNAGYAYTRSTGAPLAIPTDSHGVVVGLAYETRWQ